MPQRKRESMSVLPKPTIPRYAGYKPRRLRYGSQEGRSEQGTGNSVSPDNVSCPSSVVRGKSRRERTFPRDSHLSTASHSTFRRRHSTFLLLCVLAFLLAPLREIFSLFRLLCVSARDLYSSFPSQSACNCSRVSKASSRVQTCSPATRPARSRRASRQASSKSS